MDRARFETLWTQSEPGVRAFLAACCRDAAAVQDLAQEVALAAWQKREQYDATRDFQAWLIGMARLIALRKQRDFARQRVFLAPDLIESAGAMLSAESPIFEARREALAGCRERLGAPMKTLLALRLAENLPLEDVARRLNRSHGAVRTALSRVRDWLRACIDAKLAGNTASAPPGENS